MRSAYYNQIDFSRFWIPPASLDTQLPIINSSELSALWKVPREVGLSRAGKEYHNGRLEFLGDRIWHEIIGEIAFDEFPDFYEKDLTKLTQPAETNAQMAIIATHFGLQNCIIGDETGRLKLKTKVRADLLEAYVCALFKDQGRGAVKSFLIPILRSCLQYYANKNRLSAPSRMNKRKFEEFEDEHREDPASDARQAFTLPEGSISLTILSTQQQRLWANIRSIFLQRGLSVAFYEHSVKDMMRGGVVSWYFKAVISTGEEVKGQSSNQHEARLQVLSKLGDADFRIEY
ncbi:hypothetical protein ABW19_dt0208444 [Dactylella cylindrospora]|nr:hypothetical protein ABW19_dt0208444 [Dactylella cylindrospora]